MPPDPPDTTRSMYTTLKQLATALLFDYKIKLFVKSIDASLVLRPFQLSSKMFSLYGKQYTDFFVVVVVSLKICISLVPSHLTAIILIAL